MKLYLVTCDLVAAGDYRSFREKMRTIEATQILAAQVAGSQHPHRTATKKDELKGYLDRGDAITVIEVGEERASRRAKADLMRA